MTNNRLPITAEGYVQLEEELKNLKLVERPAISSAISEARELGDLSENAEYHAAREKQSFIEGRIIELEDKMARATIIDISKIACDSIKFGATITLIDEDTDEECTYRIVGEYEADINKGHISINSPLARALISKKVGDSAEVTTPSGGSKSYEIIAIQYK